jgi:hypothetical protein
VVERSRKFSAVGAGKAGAMIEPVEPGDDGNRQIAHRVTGEFDHRVIVRQLAKIAVQYRGLRTGFGEQSEFAPRHRQQIAHGFQPRVVADLVLVGASIRRDPLAGRIDPFPVVGLVEILPALLLDISQQRMRSIRRRRSFSEWPASQLMKTLLDSKARQFVRKFHTRHHLTALYARTRIQHGATLE